MVSLLLSLSKRRLFRHSHITGCLTHSFSTLSSSSISHNDRWKREKPISAIDFRSVVSCSFCSYASRLFRFSTVHELFDEMPHRDSYVQEAHLNNFLDLLKSSMTSVDIGTVMIAHCLALKIGFLASLRNSTMLLTLYSRAGDLASSLALFGELNDKDMIVWNSMITALVHNHNFAAALELFVDMVEKGTGFDSIMLLLVVSALSHLNHLKLGRLVHGLGLKGGMVADSCLSNALVNLYAKCGDLYSAECIFAGMEYKDLVSWNTITTGCLANNYPQKALSYFKWMTCLGEEVDNVTLSSVISATTCLEELGLGVTIHGLVIKLGYSNGIHVSVANSLISLYSGFRDIEAAETIFRKVWNKDVVSYNAMIDGFASNGMILEAFDLLSEMQFLWSIQPDIATVVIMIPLCAEFILLREGRTLHGYITRRCMGLDILVMNSLIDMYSKCNLVRKAELLFKIMPERDIVSWNTMISGYSQNGHNKEAKMLFKGMIFSSSYFTLSTVLAILSSCNSYDSLAFGKSMHCWQLKLGFANNILSINSLMNMYIGCGDLAGAFFLLQTMSVTRDLASWNTIIYGCVSKGQYSEALKAFKLMRQEGEVFHDSTSLLGVISACGNLGLVKEGESLHGLALKTMKESDTQVENSLITMYGRCGDINSALSVFALISDDNLCSWNCMISALSQNKAGRKAFELFQDLEFEPNEITIVGLLSACTQLGFLTYGMQIHSYLIRHRFQENHFVSAALVDMYSNCGRLDNSLSVFDYTEVKSVSAWNSMISAYGFHGKGKEAMKLFHEMCMLGIHPNKSTFISLLSACGHSGLVDEGLWFYSQILEKYGVEPVTEHQVCVVDMLGRCGKLQEAYEFIKKIKYPEPGVWGAMLSACNYHGDMEMGKEVAELLFQLEPQNAGYYISLANMYVAAGRWKEAVKLRQIVEDKRLKKPTSYSLIDVGFARGCP